MEHSTYLRRERVHVATNDPPYDMTASTSLVGNSPDDIQHHLKLLSGRHVRRIVIQNKLQDSHRLEMR